MRQQTKVAILGGSGKMGRWFARFLLQEGNEVRITGRDQGKLREAGRELGVAVATNAEAVKWADVVVVSVSIDSVEAVIKEISLYTRPDQIMIDITSIKELPVEAMHRHIKSGLVLGVHPMFGPSAEGIQGQNFVLTPTSEDEKALAGKVREYLEARGAKVTVMAPHEHDEMMTVVLGLSHFIGLVAADTLASCQNLEQTKAVSGTTYRLLLALVKSVVSEAPELYAALQMSVPNVTEIEKTFGARVKTWADMVERKDRQAFIKRMNALKERLDNILQDTA